MTTPGPLSPNMINAGSGITPDIYDGPPSAGYYSLGVSPAFFNVMATYNNLPQISKYKQIYDIIYNNGTYNTVLLARWNGLQLGSWPALTDAAPYTGITDYPLGPAPINSFGPPDYTTYRDDPASDAGPPPAPPPDPAPNEGWRVPYSPRSYYESKLDLFRKPEARYQTRFLLTQARLVMAFDEPIDGNQSNINTDPERDLTEFAQIQGICDAYRGQANTQVNSSVNSEIVGATFTDMQNLSSGGVSQVSPAFTEFGGDLVKLGNLIDLRALSSLGYPSTLLRQMLSVGGLLPGVYDALILAGLTEQQLSSFKQPDTVIALDEEVKIYRAFVLVTGDSLTQVLELLDIDSSVPVTNAAQLLDPKKIFPNSYKTLLIQEPAATGTVQNINIYSASGTINGAISGYFVDDESYQNLKKVIPEDQALANSALIRSLLQIKNITNLDFRDFAASTAALENNNGLGAVNSLAAPVPQSVQDAVDDSLATGTGPNNSLKLYDLIGTAAGAVHQEKFTQTMEQFNTIDFTELIRLYDLCIGVASGQYDKTYFSIAPPTLTSGGSNYTSASATISPPTGQYCTETPTFTVTVTIPPMGNVGPVTAITATSLGNGYQEDDDLSITITGDGAGATATTTLGAEGFAYIELPDGRQWSACGNTFGGRLEALEALIYTASPGDNNVPGSWNTIELEAKRLVNTYPDQVEACNQYWSEMAQQLNREAMNRYMAELIFDFDTDTYPDLKAHSRSAALAMISSFHSYGTEDSQGGSADFFNAVAQSNLGGQSVIASLREGRNIEALIDAGAGVDTQIPAAPQN